MIICGFPGIGKTTAAKERDDVIDVESSKYHDNPPSLHELHLNDSATSIWPWNYVDRLEYLNTIHPDYYILASCHKKVRDALDNRRVPFIIVTPYIYDQEEYIKRFIKRRNSAEFINNIYTHWDEWICEIDQQHKHAVVHLGIGEFITDLLNDSLYNKYL